MVRVLTEEELAARDALRRRMESEQQLLQQAAQQNIVNVNVERCPHGVPLRKSCPKCDVATPDQIQDSVPLGTVHPS